MERKRDGIKVRMGQACSEEGMESMGREEECRKEGIENGEGEEECQEGELELMGGKWRV